MASRPLFTALSDGIHFRKGRGINDSLSGPSLRHKFMSGLNTCDLLQEVSRFHARRARIPNPLKVGHDGLCRSLIDDLALVHQDQRVKQPKHLGRWLQKTAVSV